VVQTVLSRWARRIEGPAGRSVAVNIAGQTLGDSEFLGIRGRVLRSYRRESGRHLVSRSREFVVGTSTYARRFIAVRTAWLANSALDDFGSGLSSLLDPEDPAHRLSQDRRRVHSQSRRGHRESGHGRGDDRTVPQPQLPRRCGAGRGPASLDAVKRMGIDFVQGS